MARETLDRFLGFVLEYEVSRPDHAHRARQALMSMATNTPVEGVEFDVQATSMTSQLDLFEQERVSRAVE